VARAGIHTTASGISLSLTWYVEGTWTSCYQGA